MTPELQGLLHATVPSARGPRALELRIPPQKLVTGKFNDEGVSFTDPRYYTIWLGNLALAFIRRVDGVRLRWDGVDELVADTELMRGFLAQLKAMIEQLRERGRVFALCPGCKTWEAEVPFQAYALMIASPFPSAFDCGMLRPLELSSKTLLPHTRAPLPPAAQIRFELPSKLLGLPAAIEGGVLGTVTHQPEEFQPPPPDDLEDDEDVEEEPAEDDFSWYPTAQSGPGWRALLRLSRAIEPPVSIETLEEQPAIDLFFLDLVYFLIAQAPIRADTPGKLTCPTCGTVFVPIRE